jgi:hypothetical protein
MPMRQMTQHPDVQNYMQNILRQILLHRIAKKKLLVVQRRGVRGGNLRTYRQRRKTRFLADQIVAEQTSVLTSLRK